MDEEGENVREREGKRLEEERKGERESGQKR